MEGTIWVKLGPESMVPMNRCFFHEQWCTTESLRCELVVFSEGGLHMVIILYVDDLIVPGSH